MMLQRYEQAIILFEVEDTMHRSLCADAATIDAFLSSAVEDILHTSVDALVFLV